MLESSKLWDFGSSSSTCLIDSRKAKGCPNKNVWRRHICVTFQKPPGCIFSLFPLSLPPPLLFLSIFFLFSDADFLTGLPRYPSVPAEIYAEEEDAEREREAKKKKKKRDTSRYDKRQPLFGRLVISLFPLPVFYVHFLKGVNNALLLSSYRI